MDGKTGHWAFLIGFALVVIAAFVPALMTAPYGPYVTWILVLLGLIVGFLNITAREVQEFLIAAVAVVIAASAAVDVFATNSIVYGILSNIVKFVFPAALVVALKAIWQLANE